MDIILGAQPGTRLGGLVRGHVGVLADPRQFAGDLIRRQDEIDAAASGRALRHTGYLAEDSSWAKVMPPAALISSIPSVPSEPVPDRITPIAADCRSSASDFRNRSIGRCVPRTPPRARAARRPGRSSSSCSWG